MKELSSDFRIGFGSFIDKTVAPFADTIKWDLQCTNQAIVQAIIICLVATYNSLLLHFVHECTIYGVNNLAHTHTHSTEFPCAEDAEVRSITADQCDPVYAFRHRLDLTDNATLLQEQLDNALLSASPDHPESLLDALLQAAVCEVRGNNI